MGEPGFDAAAEFADRGHEVVCAQIGGSSEPAQRRARACPSPNLRLTRSTADAARHGDVVILTLDPLVEFSGIANAAIEIAQNLAGPAVIVNRTRVCGPTADRVARLMARHSAHEIVVISENYRGGPAVRIFMRPRGRSE